MKTVTAHVSILVDVLAQLSAQVARLAGVDPIFLQLGKLSVPEYRLTTPSRQRNLELALSQSTALWRHEPVRVAEGPGRRPTAEEEAFDFYQDCVLDLWVANTAVL